MELTIGKHAGFCFGVRRAVQTAFDAAKTEVPCVTLGPLIHNPQEVERLERAGIRAVASLDEVEPGQTVIIRSHGVTPDVYARCEARGIHYIDATCPHVAHIHELVRTYSAGGGELTVRMPICAATSQRQQEAGELSRQADVMVVVGGRNSSNTQKLYETCRARCPRTLLVETPEDLPEGAFSATDRVAITAGASTPQWLLDQVRARIEAGTAQDSAKE